MATESYKTRDSHTKSLIRGESDKTEDSPNDSELTILYSGVSGNYHSPQSGGNKKSGSVSEWNCFPRFLLLVTVFLTIGYGFLTYYYFTNEELCINQINMEHSIFKKEEVMDSTVDPCDDFYKYACGRWNHGDSSSRFYVSVVEETDKRNRLRLESLLKCSTRKRLNSWGKFMKDMYNSCDRERRSSTDSSKTVAFVKHLAAPLIEDVSPPCSLDSALRRVHHRELQSGLFTWDMTLDLQDKKIIQVLRISPAKKPSTGDLMAEFTEHVTEYMMEVLTLLGAREERIRSKCEEMAEFDVNLRTARNDTKSKARPSVRQRFSYNDFVREFDFINFNRYFGEVPMSKNVSVVVENPEYFKWLKNYIKTREVNDATVQNYIMWSAVDFFIPYMPRIFGEKRASKLDAKEKSSVENDYVCVDTIRKGMNFAASSFFMEKIIDGRAREMINEIVLHIKNAYRDFLHSLQHTNPGDRKWLDGLNDVFQNIEIGVPNHLQKIYEDDLPFNTTTNTFHMQYLSAVTFVKNKMLSLIHDPPYGVLFLPDLLQLNGIFISLPLLLVNMAVLTPPLFDPNQLFAYNYAGFGFVLAHELAHSAEYLAENTSSIKGALTFKSDCLVTQYADLKREIDVRQEDFADNVAVKIAYNAYIEHFSRHCRLPHDQSTLKERKMFFVHYSQILCEDGSSFNVNHNAFHSPYKYRVNKPLSNLPEFLELFSCPAGSRMNTNEKCIL